MLLCRSRAFIFTGGMRSHLASRDMQAQADNPLLGIFVGMLGLESRTTLTIEPRCPVVSYDGDTILHVFSDAD